MNRRSLAIAVLGFWALVLAWHIRREYFKPMAVRLAEAQGAGHTATSHRHPQSGRIALIPK